MKFRLTVGLAAVLVAAVAGCDPTPAPDDERPIPVVPEMPPEVLRYTRCVDALDTCRTSGILREARPMLECLRDARICTPEELTVGEPNGCCPSACIDLGIALEMTQTDRATAYTEIFSRPHACFPGAKEGMAAWEAESDRLNETVNQPAMRIWDEKLKAIRLEEERRRAERVGR